MQGVFTQALTYSPPAILGRQLLPFSPWHGLVLEASGNRYLTGGVPTGDDLIVGLWVCGCSFVGGIEACADKAAIERWGKAHGKGDLAAAAAAFGAYIEAGLRCPEYWADAQSKPVRAPYWWHLALFGQRHLGLCEAGAWDAPVSRLACYRACYAESQGWDKLKSASEIAGIEVLLADAAAEAAKGK